MALAFLCVNDKDDQGIAYWLVFGRYLARLADGWGAVSQMIGVVLVGLFMTFFMGLEAMMPLAKTIPGLCACLVVVGFVKKLFVKRGEEKKREQEEREEQEGR